MGLAACLVLALAAAGLGLVRDWTTSLLFVLALALGGTLWRSAFSFAGAWRRLTVERRTAGVRAQLLLVGLSACLFLPALAAGEVLGQPVRGFVFPIGWALLIGAFLFGIGMQLAGGCGSGTLYAAGSFALRSWLTLGSFIIGATLAAWGADLWSDWPALSPLSLAERFGTVAVLAVTLLAVGGCFATARAWEAGRYRDAASVFTRAEAGRWSLGIGAIILAVLGFAVLLAAGRPWAITAAFPLWGSKLIERAGLDDPVFWTFWDDPTRAEALLRPLLADRTTIMDLGVIGGAFLAVSLTRAPQEAWRMPGLGPGLASLLGGIMMGVGAVLASGCNISAFVGGIASGSAHGWVWIAAAIPGSILGTRARRWFRLP